MYTIKYVSYSLESLFVRLIHQPKHSSSMPLNECVCVCVYVLLTMAGPTFILCAIVVCRKLFGMMNGCQVNRSVQACPIPHLHKLNIPSIRSSKICIYSNYEVTSERRVRDPLLFHTVAALFPQFECKQEWRTWKRTLLLSQLLCWRTDAYEYLSIAIPSRCIPSPVLR